MLDNFLSGFQLQKYRYCTECRIGNFIFIDGQFTQTPKMINLPNFSPFPKEKKE